jgi:hypothetical protein
VPSAPVGCRTSAPIDGFALRREATLGLDTDDGPPLPGYPEMMPNIAIAAVIERR